MTDGNRGDGLWAWGGEESLRTFCSSSLSDDIHARLVESRLSHSLGVDDAAPCIIILSSLILSYFFTLWSVAFASYLPNFLGQN